MSVDPFLVPKDYMTEFSNLGLSPTTLAAVAATGYTIATPIQEQAIPVALAGRDVLGIAQTGTGKTAAFTLPMIDRLQSGRARARMPRALVLAPTRELADQVASSFEKYAKGTKLSWVLLIGGVSMGDQVAALNKGVDVLIATPGRLLDLFERGKMLLTGVELMVVDEADRMLDMGFIPDIERIFKLTPPRRQTLFFSATMPPEITRLTQQFLRDPTRIEASRPAMTADTITQFVAPIPSSDPKAKREALRALIRRSEVNNGIVFCNRKSEVDVVAKSLKRHGFDVAPIHGDLDQSVRMKTLAAFRAGELKLLVASDVAARGLDIPEVSHVFNYDVPHHADDYVHRIGRTGRAGRSGEAYMIITPADEKSYDKVLKLTRKIPETLTLEPLATMALPERAERDSRRRRERTSRVAEMPAEAAVAPAAVIAAIPANDTDDAPCRRDRNRARRAPGDLGLAGPVPIKSAASAPIAHETDRPARTTVPRERGGGRGGRPAPGSTAVPVGRGFGDDVPAFLRRPVRIRS